MRKLYLEVELSVHKGADIQRDVASKVDPDVPAPSDSSQAKTTANIASETAAW